MLQDTNTCFFGRLERMLLFTMERSFATPVSPNVLLWTMIGDVTAADIHCLFAEQVAFCRGKSGIYVIVDMTRMKQIDGEARRAAARAPMVDGKPMPIKAIAIIGGRFQFRILGKMINTAAAILNRIEVIPLEFFDSVPQARAWIETRAAAQKSS